MEPCLQLYLPTVGLEPETSGSVDQRLTHWSTRAPSDKRGYWGYFKDNFSYLSFNIVCGPFLEPSQRDGSNGGPNMFYEEIWKIIPKLSL